MDTNKEEHNTDKPDIETSEQHQKVQNYDWEKHDEKQSVKTLSMRNNTSQSNDTNEEELLDTQNPETMLNNQDDDISIAQSISQIFGNKIPGKTPITHEIETTLIIYLGCTEIPQQILEKFKIAQWINPSTIINIFGGNLQALAQQLCYHKPSLFTKGIS